MAIEMTDLDNVFENGKNIGNFFDLMKNRPALANELQTATRQWDKDRAELLRKERMECRQEAQEAQKQSQELAEIVEAMGGTEQGRKVLNERRAAMLQKEIDEKQEELKKVKGQP